MHNNLHSFMFWLSLLITISDYIVVVTRSSFAPDVIH